MPEKRQLTFDGRVIKQFRVPSCNQEAILMAFEEEGWPERIFDPLIPKPGIEMKRRVMETIKSMNRSVSMATVRDEEFVGVLKRKQTWNHWQPKSRNLRSRPNGSMSRTARCLFANKY